MIRTWKKEKKQKNKIGDWFGRVIPLETQPSSRLKVSLLKDICLQSYYYNARITFKSGREEMISVRRGEFIFSAFQQFDRQTVQLFSFTGS